ncbi:hypothetical protein NPIL_324321 [Nephila pilipes]|uniref:G-protein coupled receptors family 1 profile domain-containing protein n=1 Tax=Nephila pilipes TaxID=299642 RepID=A0A8X6UX96_NEPPI|nr:hypothetical protein NPIL_324321 [Nephila pilipes]
MASIVIVFFIFYWSPLQAATLYSKVWLSGTQQGELPPWFHHFQYTSMLLVHFNCALNPFLYAVLSKDFRRSLFRVVRCKVTRQSGRPNLTIEFEWHHIKSDVNPADSLSRDLCAEDLIGNKLWWCGPELLYIDTNFSNNQDFFMY